MVNRILFAFVKLFTLCLLLLVVSSCVSIERLSTNIQTLASPDKITGLPAKANIAIVASIYVDTRHDSMKERGFPNDSLMLVKAAFALKNKLEESPKYAGYDFPIYSLPRMEIEQNREQLSPEDIAMVSASANAQYLISIEYLKADLWHIRGRGIDEEYGIYSFVRTIVPSEAVFRIYDVAAGTVLDEKIVGDTLVYETVRSPYESIGSALSRMPDPVNAVPVACERLAFQYADRIAPKWLEEVRYYYSTSNSNADMNFAASCVRRGQWSEAVKTWMKYVDDSDVQLATIARFNLALGCEMMGEYELAIEWLQSVKLKNPKYYSPIYENMLKARIDEKTTIDKAMK
ncbi:MAG: tetratricopeptide repeat protein [Prevotellaceae bacterium]|nr:tetratricopeptide repeat protein [Prevotellaceae bacterium]